MRQLPADEECYRDFVLSVLKNSSGHYVVNVAPTPPTLLSYATLNRRGHTVFSHPERAFVLETARAYIDNLLDEAG
jgi:hypothetical protein